MVSAPGDAARAPVVLTAAQLQQYHRDGFALPVSILSAPETALCRQRLDELVQRSGRSLTPRTRVKPHLYLKWVSDVIRHPRVVGAVTDVLGRDVLLWRSTFFIKAAGDSAYTAWHQDSVYWRFDCGDVMSVWVALTDSTVANGCVRFVPGSHRQPEMPHRPAFDRRNVLLRGQVISAEIPLDRTVPAVLAAGQASVHHVGIVHGSLPNQTPTMRAGLVLRFIAAHARRTGLRESAMLVSGNDSYGYFDHEPVPRLDDDPLALAYHRRAVRSYVMEVLQGILRHPSPRQLAVVARILAKPTNWRLVFGRS